MKKIPIFLGLLFLTACSSTRFVASWKNSEVTRFQPDKLLVLGMTNNLTARQIFEEELKDAFLERNINAEESASVLKPSFTAGEKSEEEIDSLVQGLSEMGFDAIVITAVKGVDETHSYTPAYYTVNYRWARFGPYYHRYQDVLYTPNYYSEYRVYHIETSIYNIDQADARSLVWVGSFEIVNPQGITPVVQDYVDRILSRLEAEGLVEKI